MDPNNVPPEIIAAADQVYAQATENLDDLIATIRKGLKRWPEWNTKVSVVFMCNAIDYTNKLDAARVLAMVCGQDGAAFERDVHEHSARLMMAAVFRLAMQAEQRDPLEDLAK